MPPPPRAGPRDGSTPAAAPTRRPPRRPSTRTTTERCRGRGGRATPPPVAAEPTIGAGALDATRRCARATERRPPGRRGRPEPGPPRAVAGLRARRTTSEAEVAVATPRRSSPGRHGAAPQAWPAPRAPSASPGWCVTTRSNGPGRPDWPASSPSARRARSACRTWPTYLSTTSTDEFNSADARRCRPLPTSWRDLTVRRRPATSPPTTAAQRRALAALDAQLHGVRR